MMVYGSDSCGTSRSSFETFFVISTMALTSFVGSGGGPSDSGMAFTVLNTAMTASRMLNTGMSGVSAG